MSLQLALNNALSGLQVSQRALSVLSQNISNANTAGYSRQVVDQSARYVAGIGSGVTIDSIDRKVDEYLKRALEGQASDVARADVISDYMERLQVMLGEPGRDNSLDGFVQSFFNSLQAMAESPELPSLRTTVVNNGTTLAREVSGLADQIFGLRYTADRDIVEAVKQINLAIDQLHTTNRALHNAAALNAPTAELLDDRDRALRTLSDYLNVRASYDTEGEVSVSTDGGITLLDDRRYHLQYASLASQQVLVDDGTINAITVVSLDDTGNVSNTSLTQTLVTSGTSSQVTTGLTTGKLKGLLDLRDSLLNDTLAQLDGFAARLRDLFNALHNDGSGFPGASSLTGTRDVAPDGYSQWSGTARIALLDRDGTPILPQYNDEAGGIRPLTINFSQLDGGFGAGFATTQSIIDEINWHFGAAQGKVDLGDLNNIRLVSLSNSTPGSPAQFQFDLEAENLGRVDNDIFVTGVSVFDSTGANITSVTQTIPQVTLDPAATFTTTNGSTTVRVSTSVPHGFTAGQLIKLANPGGPVNGIPAAQFDGFFTIANVTTTGFDILVNTPAAATGAVGVPGQTALPKYDTVLAGEKSRTKDQGTITASLAGNPVSAYYDIMVDVATYDGSGTPQTSTITYRVANTQSGLFNDRYSPSSATGTGIFANPERPAAVARALLVDADGNEVAKNANGQYIERGFLKIEALNGDYTISIDEMNSKEEGLPATIPIVPGSNRHFSHYFELNNFFVSNEPTSTGDTVRNSAINMAVDAKLRANPTLVTTGKLTRSTQPVDSADPALYTYERFASDNDSAQVMAKLGVDLQSFDTAGTLPSTTQTFTSYVGQILGLAASGAVAAKTSLDDETTLLNGFQDRAARISGVNLDEELANTLIYQNAYTASARVITVTNELFDTLLNAF